MSDYRTAVSRLGTALASRKSGTSNTGRGAYDLQAQELKYKVQLLEILRKLKEDADDREAKLKLASIRAEIKLFEIQQRRAIESDKITAANYRTEFQEIRRDKREITKQRANYALKFASSYDAIDRLMLERLEDTKGKTGINKVNEIWKAFGEGESLESKSVKGYNQQDPRFLGTFEKAAELSNRTSLKSLFKKDKDNRYVLDEAVAKSIGIDPNSEAYKRIKSKTEAYNKGVASDATYKQASNAALAEADQLLAAAEADFAAGKEESGREKLEAFKSMQSKAESEFNFRNNVGDGEENQRILDRETESGRLYQQVEALLGSSGKKSLTRRENDALTIGDSEFQQWARDNGYDAIGKVYVDEDGNKSYITGGDDKVALYHFSKEMKRAPGDYGANPGGTGEIVDVTIIDENGDPQVIRGERLRIHPADPYGTVRMNTERGYVAIPRNQMTALTVIHRPSVGQTLGDKIASGNWFAKTFDDFSDFSYQGDTDDLVRTADGLFVISEDGSPMTQDEYDDARSDLAAEAGLKIVYMGAVNKAGDLDTSAGNKYLYLGDDENGVGIYQEIDQETNALTPVKSLNVRADLDTKVKRDAFLASDEEDKALGLLTKEAIFKKKIDGVEQLFISEHGAANLDTDLDPDGNFVSKETLAADKQTRDDLVRETAEKLTAADLKSKGVTTTAQAPLQEGFQVREIGDVASTPWSELIKPEVEPEPEEEPEEGLTSEQRRAKRQARRSAKRIGRTLEKAQPEFEQLSESAQLAEMGLDPDKLTPEAIESDEREGMKLGRQARRARLLAMLKGKTVDPDPITGPMDMSFDQFKDSLYGFGPLVPGYEHLQRLPESPDPTESMTDVEVGDVPSIRDVGDKVRAARGIRLGKRLERRRKRKDKDSVESDAQVSNQIVPTSGMV